ncbi:MAG: hypothetical protein IVW54_16610 [Candidatus Binataceae bacterium]|nr:hypothetical protein [Candidatus Binataceae bacterium]
MQRPTDRPDARMTRPPCPLCNSHRTLTLFDQNVPCPRCSAPERAQDAPLVHPCPDCGQAESIAPGLPCGVCRGRALVESFRRNQASELLSLDEIVRDREAAQ